MAVQGPAADLELFLSNRRGTEDLKVFGDKAKLASLARSSSVIDRR